MMEVFRKGAVSTCLRTKTFTCMMYESRNELRQVVNHISTYFELTNTKVSKKLVDMSTTISEDTYINYHGNQFSKWINIYVEGNKGK